LGDEHHGIPIKPMLFGRESPFHRYVRRVGVPLSSHITYITAPPKFCYVFVVAPDRLVAEGLTEEEVDTAAPVSAGVGFEVTVKYP
jgi:hypothetical protein